MRLANHMSPYRWTEVDGICLPSNLTPNDVCFYYLEYTSHAGYQASDANQWVFNYKIPADALRTNPSRQYYKKKAIMEYANAICHLIPAFKVGQASTPILKLGNRVGMLPVPPSKAQDDPHYDDRNFQTVTQICSRTGFRLCRDIETISPIVASHSGGTRNPQTIKQSLGRIARNANECDWVFLVDDVLVSGAHFVAVSELLRETEFTGEIIGLFLARSNS